MAAMRRLELVCLAMMLCAAPAPAQTPPTDIQETGRAAALRGDVDPVL